MVTYAVGDLFLSNAQALVNAVNCEGYMGKGIAYQFKQRYPRNFEEYRNACKSGYLRPGKLVWFQENEKLIINFPTKDKWKNDSRMEYIEAGLDSLVGLINSLNIESVAIPPLGAGNGGLVWGEVRKLLEDKLSPITGKTEVIIYEPSKAVAHRPVQEPKLSTSSLVLMEIKKRLNKFSSFRLQKTSYFMNLFLEKPYFKFVKYKYGPYSHPIDVICSNIKEYQRFHGLSNTAEVEEILYRRITSKTVDDKLKKLMPALEKACNYVNSIDDNDELECLATVCFIVESNQAIPRERIIDEFVHWSSYKAEKFNRDTISAAIDKLYNDGLIDCNLEGCCLSVHEGTL